MLIKEDCFKGLRSSVKGLRSSVKGLRSSVKDFILSCGYVYRRYNKIDI